jgi:hypothetical protein
MTFQQAKDKVKRLAEGKYHGISFELNEFSTGEQRIECSIYIADETWYKGSSWEGAFIVRERAMQPPEIIQYEITSFMPQGDF